jgi:putative Ca2+/H+ antiporter (TMEM165/GDT1 family)
LRNSQGDLQQSLAGLLFLGLASRKGFFHAEWAILENDRGHIVHKGGELSIRANLVQFAATMDWNALLTSFGLVLVAELGDKTQLAVLAQTCKYRRPWAVFFGASLALVAVTALGVVGGQLVSQLVPSAVLRWVAAVAFVVMGVFVAREAAGDVGEDSECACLDGEVSGAAPLAGSWRALAGTFGLLFVAELGDKTQLAVLSMATKSTPWLVFAGGGLALTAVTGLAVVGGEGLCRLIPQRVLLGASSVAFVVMGVLMGMGVI